MSARRVLLSAITASVLLGASLLQAQQARDQMQTPRTGTAGISGVIVTDEATPQPLKRVQVTVISPEAQFTKMVFTNETGKFAFTGLPAGRYTLAASKPAYLRVAYGARRWDRPGTPITLKDGQQMTDISLRMTRGAVLSGVILDENGLPAFGVSVRTMQMRMVNGERTFINVASSSPLGETTDDRGMYRFFGLPPGEYAITASPRFAAGEIRAMTESEIRAIMQALQQQQTAAQQQATLAAAGAAYATQPPPAQPPKPDPNLVTVGFANVYYPGTTVASAAATVPVAAGEERTGVDFPLKLVRTARIEGMVVTPPGVRPQNVQLMLAPITGAGAASLEMVSLNRTAVDAEGKFAFTAVPPGQYMITARATASAGGAQPGQRIEGMPAVQGTMQFQTIRVAPPGGGGGAEPMMVMPEMTPQGAGGPTYWGEAEVAVDGTSLAGITVSLQLGMTITGKVTFKSSQLVPGSDLSRVRINLASMPTPGAQRITMGAPQTQVDANGQFRITGVMPGRYRITGVAPLPPGSAPGQGWTLLSAVARGKDVLDFPLEIGPNDEIADAVITFTDVTQEVNGSLQDATGRPAPDFTIVVFAADNRFWTTPSRRIRSTRPGTDGRFTVSNLPPGEYRIAALVDVAPGEINDPAFLEQLVAASVKVTLAEGERKTQDLRIAGGL